MQKNKKVIIKTLIKTDSFKQNNPEGEVMKRIIPLGLSLGLLAMSSLVQAETFIVNETDDALSDGTCDAVCTLRDAVQAANTNGDLDNTITFAASDTYEVDTMGTAEDANEDGDIDILNNFDTGEIKKLTISGLDAEPVIIAGINDSERVLQVPFVENQLVSLTIERVTITGGNDDIGGGLLYVGAISNIPSEIPRLTIRDSHITQNQALVGGGVAAAGIDSIEVQIDNSTFSENSATDGAGGGTVFGQAFVKVNNSTWFGNSATVSGGGIGIASGNFDASLSLNSVTIVGNSSDDNGGGIATGATGEASLSVAMRNTILAGNTAAVSGADCQTLDDTSVNSEGYNAVGIINPEDCNYVIDVVSDIEVDINADPLVEDALANNGGPTPTLALALDSLALNAGNPEGCLDADNNPLETDQRIEVARIIGPACDIGAYEADWADLTVEKTSSEAEVNAGDTFTYTITVSNLGVNDASNVQVVDNLPAEVEFISVTPADVCEHVNGIVTCDIPLIESGQSVEITIEVKVQDSEVDFNIVNTANATSDQEDPTPEDSTDEVTVSVKGNPVPEQPDYLEGSGEIFGCSLNSSNASMNPLMIIGMAGIALLVFSLIKRREVK